MLMLVQKQMLKGHRIECDNLKAQVMNADELTSKLKCLLEELRVNRDLAANQYEVGGRVKMKLATLVWDAVENGIDGLGKDLALDLRFAYGEVWRFNAIVENFDSIWDHLLPSGDTVESLMADKALRAKISLIMAEQKLSAYLAG